MRPTGEAATMIDLLLKTFFSCPHRRLGFPITVRHDPHLHGSRYGKRTYVICLNCGTELPYSWDEMRIERAEAAIITACGRQLVSWYESVRAALSKNIHLDIQCRVKRDGVQEHRTWRIRIGQSSASNSVPPRQGVHQHPREAASPSLDYFPPNLPP